MLSRMQFCYTSDFQEIRTHALNFSTHILEKLAKLLPFAHGVEMEKALFRGDLALGAEHALPVALYSIAITAIAIFCFLRQMKRQ